MRTEFAIYVYYFKMANIVWRERRSCVHDEWNRYFVTVYQVMMARAKTSEVMISILQFGTLGLSLLWTVTLHEVNSDRKYKLWNVISTERYLGLWFVMFQNRTVIIVMLWRVYYRIKRIFSGVYLCITWTNSLTNK